MPPRKELCTVGLSLDYGIQDRFMKMHKRSILTVVLFLYACASCQLFPPLKPTITPSTVATSIPTPFPTDPPLPTILEDVFPRGTISLSTYDASRKSQLPGRIGVSATVAADRDRVGSGSFTLTVDKGNLMFVDSIVDGLMEHGPFYVSWTPELKPGYHEAVFELTYDNGERVRYTWHFVITDD